MATLTQPAKASKSEQASIHLTENARTVLTKRYLRKGPDGKPVETVAGMFRRVARHIAQAEVEWGGGSEETLLVRI